MRTTGRRLVAAAAPVLMLLGAAPAATALPFAAPVRPAGSSTAQPGTDTEITFESGGITLHGTLHTPARPRPGVAALLLPGSGPTDRNGNQPGLTADTIARIADT